MKARSVEFEVRRLDEHGDAFDVDHYATAKEALAVALRDWLSREQAAVVVERHDWRIADPDRAYTEFALFGDTTAIERWRGGAR